MISKVVESVDAAVADITDGATLMLSGFGMAGHPTELVEAVHRLGVRELTVINNNAGNGDRGLAMLIRDSRVRKMICSFPRQGDSWHFDAQYRSGAVELELVPQGTLAERIRAAGAGIGGFFTRTAAGTQLAEGKETRTIDGHEYVYEQPLFADFALVRAWASDPKGNLIYRKTARNFGPVMASAATTTIAEVAFIVERGDLDPDHIVTPGVFVDRVVAISSANPHEVHP